MRYLQTFCRKIKNIPPKMLIAISIVVLLVITLISLCFGAVFLSFKDLMSLHDILVYVRLPRVMAAVFAGVGLSGTGVVIQTILGNPLAGPNIIGVNSGAGFMTVVGGLMFPFLPSIQPVAAFLGALAAVLVVYFLSKKTGASKMTILLSGVVINSLFNSMTEALYTFYPNALMNISSFRVGGLASVQTSVLVPAAVLITISCIVVCVKSKELELLALGDDVAHSLGISVNKLRFMFLICAACMAGASVSFAGLVGFLGLIVPHGARLIVGEEVRYLFPISIIWGGILMVVCDTLSRTLFAPFELSVGIMLSVIGAPIFIMMLFYKKRGY